MIPEPKRLKVFLSVDFTKMQQHYDEGCKSQQFWSQLLGTKPVFTSLSIVKELQELHVRVKKELFFAF